METDTRPELAKNIGISTTIDVIGAGKRIGMETAGKAAEYFDVKPNTIFEMTGGTLSDRTVLHHHRLISTIMQSAVYDEIIYNFEQGLAVLCNNSRTCTGILVVNLNCIFCRSRLVALSDIKRIIAAVYIPCGVVFNRHELGHDLAVVTDVFIEPIVLSAGSSAPILALRAIY